MNLLDLKECKYKKPTILSGPQMSGKSWIARAIANQYKSDRVRICFPKSIKKKIKKGIGFIKSLQETYDLIVIDECSTADINIL